MSYDIALYVRDGKGDSAYLYERNVTYNYQPCIAAAGLRSFKDLHHVTASSAVGRINSVLADLERNPDKGDLIKGDDTEWPPEERYQDLMHLLRDLREMSERFPTAKWEVT